jgi:UDP-2,3-diacylglucosamine pyrophosphatase LpxH
MKYRAIWISDVHLGSRHSQVNAVLDFLRQNESDHLYLVGDIIEGWQLRNTWFWPDDCNVFIQKLLRRNRKSTRITYLYGNHDEFLEDYKGLRFGSLRLAERVIHTAADGKRYLVLHGHQFDGLVHCNRLLERVGSGAYELILHLNRHMNRALRRLGFGYWSVAAFLKAKAKSAVRYVTDFEVAMATLARRNGVDGIICGHIHKAEIRDMDGIRYLNCGDWVENCTALVEDLDGTIRLIHFHEQSALPQPIASRSEVRSSNQSKEPHPIPCR